MNLRIWIVCSLSIAGIVSTTAGAATQPISAFARLEQVRGASISPDGRYLLYVSQLNGNRVAVTIDLQKPDWKPQGVFTVGKENDFELTWCRWANDSRLLCAVQAPTRFPTRVYRTSRMIAVNADGTGVKTLNQNTSKSFSWVQDEVLDLTPDQPETVLVQSYEARDGIPSPDTYPSVFELNIHSGNLKRHTREHPPVREFYSDGKGNIRLGRGLRGTTYQFFARLDGDKDWRLLSKVEAFEGGSSFVPHSVIPGTNLAYAFGPSGDRRGLYKIDLEDRVKPELLFDHPLVDVAAPIRTPEGRLLGVAYETDRPFVYYTDEKISALMQGVNKIFPSTFNMPVSFSRDYRTIVIATQSDTEAGAYYLFDVATGKVTRIGRMYPELDPETLPRMRSVEYKAADGTSIPGYLTAPLSVREERLPLIVMPHGGPRSRDSWRFDFLRHFLVSRGYAVLQMNFRGSTGYGGKWFSDAFQDWGGLTYSDISDAARWAIAEGIADPKRVCIVGWSFGGYAALVGATRNADLFKCSVSIAGVSDLNDLRLMGRGTVGAAVVEKQIGSDRTKLRASSPVEHAEDVKMPVLLIHGTLDAQAPYEQSRDMAAALKKAGKQFKFVTIDDADHGLTRVADRTLLLTEIEQFLQSNLGVGAAASN